MSAAEKCATLNDFELMLRAQRGEVEAFALLYDRYAPSMLALGKRMLGAIGEAQELLHDVFLEAWLSVRDYDPARGSLRTWLLVRMRSRALDRLGRRRLERRVLVPQPMATSIDPRSAHPERRVALRQALDQLDESVRISLELTYFEGLTAAETAERMQVPEGTVRSRIARGISALEQLLRELEGTDHGE